jgi:hypothetical protein
MSTVVTTTPLSTAARSACCAYLLWFGHAVAAVTTTPPPTTATYRTQYFAPNATVAARNPLRGFAAAPAWTAPPFLPALPTSLEFHYVPLNAMFNASGSAAAMAAGFDSYLEPRLAATAARGNHAVLRFFLDYPSRPSAVPHYLLAAPHHLAMTPYTEHGGGVSPDYTSEPLLAALEAFVAALGARYDGDRRLGFLQVGLLGFWGEWHTYPHTAWLDSAAGGARDRVVAAFGAAFATTHLQLRVPHTAALGMAAATHPGLAHLGLHDDSFAYSTLDGAPNGGGAAVPWFFWPSVLAAGFGEAWRTGAMGGEVRPELQATIFDGAVTSSGSGYAAGTPFKQDFGACVAATHATFMLNNFAFARWTGGYGGAARPPGTLERARAGALLMGYRFWVSSVAATEEKEEGGGTAVSLAVNVTNDGVAPFYYPLSLSLALSPSCAALAASDAGSSSSSSGGGGGGGGGGGDGGGGTRTLPGVQRVMPGMTTTFTFAFAFAAAAAADCIGAGVQLSLLSDFTYASRPVLFAQNGGDAAGGALVVRIARALPPPPATTTEACGDGAQLTHWSSLDPEGAGAGCFCVQLGGSDGSGGAGAAAPAGTALLCGAGDGTVVHRGVGTSSWVRLAEAARSAQRSRICFCAAED